MSKSYLCSSSAIRLPSPRPYKPRSWSDGPHWERDAAGAVCIDDRGGYQFRLFPSGEENPPLFTMDGIPLYKWDGQAVQMRTEAEIAEDRDTMPELQPSTQEQLRADVDFLTALQGVSL